MYETYWDKDKKQPRCRSIQAFGYVEDLVCPDMPDPIGFYKNFVEQENARRAEFLADEDTAPCICRSAGNEYRIHAP